MMMISRPVNGFISFVGCASTWKYQIYEAETGGGLVNPPLSFDMSMCKALELE